MTLAPQSTLTAPVMLGHNATYDNFVDAHFMRVTLREDLRRLRGIGWPTRFTGIDSIGEVLCSASYRYKESQVVLSRLPTALAMLVIQPQGFVGRLAANSEDALDQAEQMLREAVPEAEHVPEREAVPFLFWRANPNFGAAFTVVKLEVPTWEAVAGNYSLQTRQALKRAMSSFRPGHGGRLMLWTGPPGTGKTYALRALAWEWREWCSVHYITDPEALFGTSPEYLMTLLARPVPTGHWRLLVLEDTGELLSADAKSRTGQALSRLLNSVDGLLGQGFPTLVLVTTNEPVRTLHPAIARPGRCAQHVEFGPLDAEAAQSWLTRHGCTTSEPRAPRTLAELYAIADDYPTSVPGRKIVGFAR